MNFKHAFAGAIVASIAVGAYDEYRITDLEAQVAQAQAEIPHTLASDRQVSCLSPNRTTPAPIPQQAADANRNAAMAIFAAARQARESLWARTYQRPATCDNPPDNDAFVACGNAYANAHKRFLADHPLSEFLPAPTQ